MELRRSRLECKVAASSGGRLCERENVQGRWGRGGAAAANEASAGVEEHKHNSAHSHQGRGRGITRDVSSEEQDASGRALNDE